MKSKPSTQKIHQFSTQNPSQALKIRFAVNSCGKNKNWDFKKLAANFRDTQGTIEDVITHVLAGHALCAGLLGGKWRSKSNVIGSQWLLLDIDNSGQDANGEKIYQHQLTLEEALQHPFIRQYCALIYTTASHKPDWHKFRLIFLLPEFVQGSEAVEVLTRYLMQQLPHDPACKDASRVFYGNTEAEIVWMNPTAHLPHEWVEQAILTANQERIEYQHRIAEIEKRRILFQERAEANNWDTDQLIQQALSYIPSRSPGSGNYQECLQVLMALYSHYGALDAEIIAEQWSPSIKGTTWNIRAKIKSFGRSRRSGISIGTLFHIAKQYGFKFPSHEYSYSPNGKERLISRAEWERMYGIPQEIEDFLKNLTKAATATKIYIGDVVYDPQPQVITKPDHNNRNVDIWFKPEERQKAIIEAVKLAKAQGKIILDITHAGGGKSHQTGKFTPEQFGVDKLFYASSDHRNPTVETIERWTDLPARNNGLVADESKLTPLGNPVTRWPKPGEQPNREGNCHRTEMFHLLAANGYETEAAAEAEFNPICHTCKFRANCKGTDSEGNSLERISGATFRRDRREALADNRIRAHINSLPPAKDIKKSGLFIDEFSRQVQPVNFTEVNLNDFNFVLTELECKLPEIYAQIKHLLLPIRQYLTNEVKVTQENYYGYADAAVREIIGDIPDNLHEIISLLEEVLTVNIAELIEEADSVSLDGVSKEDRQNINRKTLALIRKLFAQDATKRSLENLKNLPVNWLVPFLKVLAGEPGSLRIKNRQLVISTKNNRQIEVIKAFDFAVLMDATATRESAAQLLGVNPDDILVICEEQPDYSNLTIHQITGFGLLGKDRSNSTKERVTALREKLINIHNGNIKFIDHLAEKQGEDGHWFVDNRGSNAYEKLEAICFFGTPYQEIGALQQIYITLTGNKNVNRDALGFSAFVNQLVQAEVTQGGGRLRAHRRPEEELTCYFVSDEDLSYLLDYYPGAKLIRSDAFYVTPEAGNASQQTRWQILQGIKQLVDAGVKVTQEAIAQTVGISQELISKTAKQFGGWKSLKKLLLLLLDVLYRNSNNFFRDLSDDELWMANEYLPLLKLDVEEHGQTIQNVVETVIHIAQSYGWQVLRRVLLHTTIETRVFLFTALISVLPPEVQEVFRRRWVEVTRS